jgi:hypothetical protein
MPSLLSVAFPCQRRFDSLLLARLQIVGVPFDVLDDVLIQDLSLEAAQRAFQALAIVKPNFCQRNSPRFPNRLFRVTASRQTLAGVVENGSREKLEVSIQHETIGPDRTYIDPCQASGLVVATASRVADPN